MTRTVTVRFCELLAAGVVTCCCRSPRDLIKPLVATATARAMVMRSAPLILVAEMQGAGVSGKAREVEKPEGVGGPVAPRIPLYLAKISARPLLILRGSGTSRLEFYSWVWASGKHGGPRLFHLDKGSVHLLFLKEEAGYLHTVCDYPNCDLEINSKWATAFMDEWRAGYAQDLELPNRVVAVRLKAEWETTQTEISEYWRDCYDLAALTSPSFLVAQLDFLCKRLMNPIGRKIACSAYAEQSKNFW